MSGGHVLALCGGVGGAKLAYGLTRVLPVDRLTIAVNTGDDFEHLGLSISPDLDTVVYTLADLADRERGWGLAGETWNFMAALRRLGGEDWFNLGDHDLAIHVERTRRLASGESLSTVTDALARRLGLAHAIVPMSDEPVRTIVETDAGPLAFQHYFVREQCRPAVKAVRYDGADRARPSAAFAAALNRPDLAAIVICPSNPYLSIGPILAVPGVREALIARTAPCVAVSPIIGGEAVKGPSAKMMRELGVEPSPVSVAGTYGGLIDGLLLDLVDADRAAEVEAVSLAARVTQTLMRCDEDRIVLARESLDLAAALAGRRAAPAA